MIRIVTDSTCDLPQELVDRYQIAVIPAYVNMGSRSIKDDRDLDRHQFYAALAAADPYPTTAAPAPGEFAAVYEGLTKEGATAIVSIHLAASLSGILNAARSGAELADSCPVTLIDSQQLSMGLGFQVLAAARWAAEGKSAVEIEGLIHNQVERTYTFCVLQRLDALQRGGRVSWLVAGVGNLLQVKPIILVYQGEVTAAERVRTHNRALRQLAAQVLGAGSLRQIAFLNTNTTETYQELLTQVTPQLPKSIELLHTIACPAIGVHIGAGAVGAVVVVD